ncbi:MAG: hypothetical protein E1N59_3192 [Puniceicoccaceae bacterium 5H]|nr:MAG: hypothetical protein E1N59_3192 [Puniceicoccaceae bacterium 5H]
MDAQIAVVGALDTKGAEFSFLCERIRAAGGRPLLIDFGVLGDPEIQADVTAQEVARAGGGDLDAMRQERHKDYCMRTMSAGLRAVVRSLFDEGRLQGIIGMGGSGGTSIATSAMRALPVAVPKLMVSTVGGGNVSAYAGTKDITFMPSVVDVAGLNQLSRDIYANAAGAIVGMVHRAPVEAEAVERPIVAASMFGNTTQAVDGARKIFEARDLEVLVFHATGVGGRTMEDLIASGYISASFDLTTTELADCVCGGVFDAGPERCLAAAQAGVPTVLVPGCVDMANFGGRATVPAQYQNRLLYEWNPDITLLRTNAEENRKMGQMIAQAANASTGPVEILLPLKGVSMLDAPGEMFWDPEADAACFDAIREYLKPGIPLRELDLNINDPEFARAAAERLLALLVGS